ncbi:MAG: hypothetical protein ABR593_07185 [Candidatus Limnocylindria bacterium]
MNGRPVEDVLEAVAPLVPRDNEQQVLSHGPRLMLAAEVLHGLGFIDDPGEPVDFTFAHDGADEAVALEPIPLAAYEESPSHRSTSSAAIPTMRASPFSPTSRRRSAPGTTSATATQPWRQSSPTRERRILAR